MTCYRSRDDWHSYVKNSLDDAELHEMTAHLLHCSECQNAVVLIQKTVNILVKGRFVLNPPADIKTNVMMAIDKNRYKENLAYVKPQAQKKTLGYTNTSQNLNFETGFKKGSRSSHLFDLKNWGISMVAAGLLLFALNLTSLAHNFESIQVAEFNSELGKQMAIPFDKMSRAAHNAFGEIESLTLYQPKYEKQN